MTAQSKTIEKSEKKYERAKKSSAPGEGKRFEALSESLEAKGAGKVGGDPDALAAWIGRKAHGAKKMAAWAAKGREG
jgi:hypothetical protein